jgi:hypothetical protein
MLEAPLSNFQRCAQDPQCSATNDWLTDDLNIIIFAILGRAVDRNGIFLKYRVLKFTIS